MVAAGHHHCGINVQGLGGKVKNRCWNLSKILDVAPGRFQPTNHGSSHIRARQAPVITHQDRLLTTVVGLTANGASDFIGDIHGQTVTDNTADIVGTENIGIQAVFLDLNPGNIQRIVIEQQIGCDLIDDFLSLNIHCSRCCAAFARAYRNRV